MLESGAVIFEEHGTRDIECSVDESNSGVGWQWAVFTDRTSTESDADIAERYYNTSR